jgi:hypothetical protein
MKYFYERLIGIILAIVVLVLDGGCSNKVINVESGWLDDEIIFNGNINDWEGIDKTFFKDEEVNLGFANDSEYIYGVFYFRNALYARIIGMAGLNVWINTERKKSKDYGFYYKGGPDFSDIKGELSEPPGGYGERNENRLRDKIQVAESLKIIDKSAKLGELVYTNKSIGLKIAPSIKKGLFIYEFKIPLEPSENSAFGVFAEPGDTLTIGFETEELSFKGKEPPSSGPPMMGGGGMPKDFGGGGERPGGFGKRPEKMDKPVEKLEIWIELKLSK